MEISKNFGFKLPSRDSGDIADINQISDNFRIIDKKMAGANEDYINNTFSNALKGTKVGKLASANDVSPIQHNLKVKLTSDTVKDFSSVEVYQQGKNIMPRVAWETSTNGGVTYVRNDDGTITLNGAPSTATTTLVLNTVANTDFSFLKPNTDYALSVEGLPVNLCFQTKKNSGGASYYSYGTANFPETETPDRLFIQIKQSQYPALENVVLKFQIEESKVATEYVPPIVKTITANADGTVDGFTSLPSMLFKTNDSSRVKINLEYNRDINEHIEVWENINEVTANFVQNENVNITIDKDSDGNPFSLKKAKVFFSFVPSNQRCSTLDTIFSLNTAYTEYFVTKFFESGCELLFEYDTINGYSDFKEPVSWTSDYTDIYGYEIIGTNAPSLNKIRFDFREAEDTSGSAGSVTIRLVGVRD